MDDDNKIFTYELNKDNRIVAVSDNWDTFARENDGEDARASCVLGRSWTDFIAGQEMRLLLIGLVDKVRESGKHLVVPFRCDGPSVHRFMALTITPKSGNAVIIKCELVREEPCEAMPVLDRGSTRGESLLTMCGWCGRAEVEGVWLGMEAAIRALRLAETNKMPVLVHSICCNCEARFAELNQAI